MKLPEIAKMGIEDAINKEVEQRLKDAPIHVFIDGMLVDIDNDVMASGERFLYLKSPVYVSETGELLKVVGDDCK